MIKNIWTWLCGLFRPKSLPPADAAPTPNHQQDWFDRCEPGDLIWAKMPLPQAELDKIEPSHWVRPYLILEKKADTLTGAACSSSPFTGLREYQTYVLAKGRPLAKQTYLNLTEDFTLQVSHLQSVPMKAENADLRRIQKNLVLIRRLDQAFHPYLPVGLQYEKGDILMIDHVLWYMQEFIPGQLRLVRLYNAYRAFMEDAGWNLFFCGHRGYFADFAHPVVFKGKTRLELVQRAAAHEIAFADYCEENVRDLHIKWVPGYIVKRGNTTLIVLSRHEKGWDCLDWHRAKKKWRLKLIRDFNGMECVGRVHKLKLKMLTASLLNLGILSLETMDEQLLEYLGGLDQDWPALQASAGTQVLVKGVNRSLPEASA